MKLSLRTRTHRGVAVVASVIATTAFLVTGAAVQAEPPGSGQIPVNPTTAPHELRVDGLDRPADLENLGSPGLSWQVATPEQTAYEVVVSSSAQAARLHRGDVWDSGKVASAAQTDVPYAGPRLDPSQRYFWTVRTWYGAIPSHWADVSWFGTGPGSSWPDAAPIWTRSTEASWTDYTLTAKVTVTAVALGIRFRAVDASDSYMWQFRGADNQLVPHKQTNGTYAVMSSPVQLPPGTLAIGKQVTVAIHANGPTITTSIDGVQVDHRTDSSYASGLVGFRTGSTETGAVDEVTVTSDVDGSTLFHTGFDSTPNPFGCGTVGGGVLSVGKSAACLVNGDSHWAFFRKDVVVADKPIAWASLFATATDWKSSKQYVYKAAVDGSFVGLGPTAPMAGETRYDGFDVTASLHPGVNTLSALAYSTSTSARFEAELVVAYADGTRQVTGTGGDWKALRGDDVFQTGGSTGTSYFAAPQENVDERAVPVGYDRPGFDDGEWPNAVEKATIPDLEAAPMAKVGEQLRAPATVTEHAPGDYVIDFGRTWLGGIDYAVAGTAGTSVQVRFGQVLNADGTVKYRTNAGNNYADSYTLRDGDQHLRTWGMRTFRYVEILGAPAPVTPDDVNALALVYPFDEQASDFASSDPGLESVYALSKNTIEATNQNFYTDSYERERTDYEADAYLQLMSSLYVMDDLSLGRYSMNYFKTNRTWPTEWPVYVILAVHDAWRQTGNTVQVADYFDNLVTKLPTTRWFDASRGLVGKTQGSNGCSSSTDCDIVDWPASERDGFQFRQYNVVINSITYQALVDMSEMAGAIGRGDAATSYAQQASALRDRINATFYNDAAGAYDDGMAADGTLTGHYSEQASAFALAFGVPEPAQAQRVASYLASRGMVCSVYCAGFLVKGLYEGDNGQAALDLLTSDGLRSWRHMVDQGAGATMEAWDPSLKSNLTYSHPWAASPAFTIPSGLFGIQPTAAGYRTFEVKPQPGDLDWARITTPTVRGSVGAAFDRQDGVLAVSMSVPGNTTASASVPAPADGSTTVYVDGVARTATESDGYLTVTGIGTGCHLVAASRLADWDEHLRAICTAG